MGAMRQKIGDRETEKPQRKKGERRGRKKRERGGGELREKQKYRPL